MTEEDILWHIQNILNCQSDLLTYKYLPETDCRFCGKTTKEGIIIHGVQYAIPKKYRSRLLSGYLSVSRYIHWHMCFPCFEAYKICPDIRSRKILIEVFKTGLEGDIFSGHKNNE